MFLRLRQTKISYLRKVSDGLGISALFETDMDVAACAVLNKNREGSYLNEKGYTYGLLFIGERLLTSNRVSNLPTIYVSCKILVLFLSQPVS